jgi:outer membrane protein TolC
MKTGVLTLLLLAVSAARAQGPLTLSQALREAARSSLAAEEAGLARKSAEEATAQARARYRPELDASAGHVNRDHPVELRSPAMTLGPYPVLGDITVPAAAIGVAEASSWRAKVGLDYLIYDFGRRSRALEAARAGETAADAQGRDQVLDQQLAVASRYLALLDLKAQRSVQAQRRRALLDHLRIAQDRLDQGLATRNDLLRTQVALRRVEDAEADLVSTYADGVEGLNRALGRELRAPLELPESLAGTPPMPWDESGARARALARNQGLRALAAKVQALDAQAAADRAEHHPLLVAEAAGAYEQNSFLVHPREYSLTLGLSWKVLDGGARSARARQAAIEAEQARRELVDARRGVEAAAAAAFRAFLQAEREVATAAANVTSSEENWRIVEDQYREGRARTADALDAEEVLADSRSQLASRRYRAFAQQAALLALLDEDLAAFYADLPER